jgi:hypothetical protein
MDTSDDRVPITVSMFSGNPPDVGTYLVTDGEEVGIDTWWEMVGDCWRLASQIGLPDARPVTRRWMKYENVVAWAPRMLKPRPEDVAIVKWMRILNESPSDNMMWHGPTVRAMLRDFGAFI